MDNELNEGMVTPTSMFLLGRFSSKVAIASTLHEPRGSLEEVMKHIRPTIRDAGLEWYISATEQTTKAASFWEYLQHCFPVTWDTKSFPGSPSIIEANHISALKLAIGNTSREYVMYIDADRLTMAFAYYPNQTALTLHNLLSTIEAKPAII